MLGTVAVRYQSAIHKRRHAWRHRPPDPDGLVSHKVKITVIPSGKRSVTTQIVCLYLTAGLPSA